MNFLAPSLLWGLFALSLPILIHLLNRRRFRTVKWAATSFLLKATRESRGRKRLKHILILAARALAVAALILAVARPVVGGLLGWGGGSIDTIVLVLDRSASMELKLADGQPSQREAVLNKMVGAAAELGNPRLILLDSATRQIQEVASPEVLPTISTTQATDSQADLPGLLLQAVDYLQETEPGNAEIWVASDLQTGDWDPRNGRWEAVRTGLNSLSDPVRLRVLTLDRSDTQNLSLTLMAARRLENEVLLELELNRALDLGEQQVPITYHQDGIDLVERLTVTGQTMSFQKRLPVPKGTEKGWGYVALPTDHNPRDNAAFFTYGEQPFFRTLVVSEDKNGPAVVSLARAAAPPGIERAEATILSPPQVATADFGLTTLLIWQAALPTGENADRVRQFIADGGVALFFPPDSADETPFLGHQWGEIENAPEEEFFVNGTWRRDDGPWRDGSSGQPLPVRALRAIKRTPIQGDGTVLAEWEDQAPLVVRAREGSGQAIFVGTRASDLWSNLEFTALHLVTVQRLLQQGSDRLSSTKGVVVGSGNANQTSPRQRLDSFEKADPSQNFFRAGIYRQDDQTVAANRPRSEDVLDRLDRDSLTELFRDTPFTLFEEADSSSSLVREIWRIFLAAMLMFLLLEAFLTLQKKGGIAAQKTT